MGTVPTSGGTWTANIASAGCTSAPFNAQAQALSTAQTAAGAVQANVSSATTTSVSGTVTQPATVSLLGVLSITLFSAGTTNVFVEAFCT